MRTNMSAERLIPQFEPLDDPIEVLGLLRAGDRLMHTKPDQWRLLRADIEVTAGAAAVLKRGSIWLTTANEPHDFAGGRLVPTGDSLFGWTSQTWIWVEKVSQARH